MNGFIRCSVCGTMIKVNSWSLVAYMDAEVDGDITEPFVCPGCQLAKPKRKKQKNS
ncbi:MAG: hypothetical protein ABFD18_06335 [Syntrophomonas sp.]